MATLTSTDLTGHLTGSAGPTDRTGRPHPLSAQTTPLVSNNKNNCNKHTNKGCWGGSGGPTVASSAQNVHTLCIILLLAFHIGGFSRGPTIFSMWMCLPARLGLTLLSPPLLSGGRHYVFRVRKPRWTVLLTCCTVSHENVSAGEQRCVRPALHSLPLRSAHL
jgi:hypothetical protein